MAHVKLITPGSQDFHEPVSHLIKLSSRGLLGSDRTSLVKRASALFAHLIDGLDIHPDIPLVHLLAMGATEDFGMNRNGDGFKRAACEKYHPTFVKYAKLYRDHQNRDVAKSYGQVKLSAYNPNMHRVELVVSLNHNSEEAHRNGGLPADREMAKLASGKEIPVSMACVLDPAYPVLTRDRGYVGIATVTVGDYVWTHQGRWRRVTQLNRRQYTGETYTFEVNALPLPLQLTADHPMLAKVFTGSREAASVKSKARRFFKDTAAFEQQPADWTHAKHIGEGDRFFYKPVTRYDGFGRIADVDLAAVMGYYCAEGSFGFNGDKACTTNFSCNMSDSLPRRLPKILQRMFPDITVDIKPHATSASGLNVELYNTEFSEFLRQYVGRGCRNKFIPPEIFNATDAVKLAFLGAWIDGDGWFDKKGGHWSSAGLNLILQGRDLLASLGVPASIYMIDHAKCPTSGKPGSGIEYTLNISHLDAWRLTEYSEKAANFIPPTIQRTKPASMRYCPDGTYAYRIKDVTTTHVENVVTYNFEVEEDESYSLGGLVSHNCRVPFDVCSWCGNEAPSREDYCDSLANGGLCKAGGLKHNIGSLVEMDGVLHQLHADNTEPTFFDISHVFRPADRIAFMTGMLKKSSAGVISGSELAEAIGVTIPYALLIDSNLPSDVQKMVKAAYRLASIEQSVMDGDLPVPVGNLTAFRPTQHFTTPPGRFREKFAELLHAMADARVCLPLPQFIALTTEQPIIKAAATAEIVQRHLPGIYGRIIARNDFETRVHHSPYTPASASSAVFQKWARQQVPHFAMSQEHVLRRTQVAALRGDDSHSLLPVLPWEKTAAAGDAAERLAEEYALYKLAFLCAIPDAEQDSPLTASLLILQNHAS